MDDVTGIIAIIMVFSIPLSAIMSGPIKQWLAQRERREARQLYERLAMEKLDVIKTAVAIGMNKTDLAELDDKLERLIGVDQMRSLLLKKEPHAPGGNELETLEAELEDESARAGRKQEHN